MNELFKNDDEILGLVRKKGLLKPSPDFTSRVMQNIGEAAINPVSYQPLLSRKAWILIISGFVLMVVFCWYALSGKNSGTSYDLSGISDKVAMYFNRFEFSLKFDANALLIVILALISMGVLLWLDLWLSNNRRGNAI
jgi:hypothetical protein